MKRNLKWTVLILMMAGLAMTVSCAKKNVAPGGGNMSGVTVDADTAAAEAEAEAAARRAALEKKKALEAQRLREQTLAEEAARAARFKEKQAFEEENVLFDYDSAVLTADARLLLKKKAMWLEENSHRNIVVQGHCDERGTTEYNLALGDRRANAVKSYLMDLGISGIRITTISYGEEKPLDPGHDEAAWARNRRAHFVIL